jgi:hypothetical protein
VTKPLHALGVIQLEFEGWASRDEAEQFAWNLLFYEPWFLGLGILVTLGTLHYHRRSGGSARGGRRLVAITIAATLLLTLFSCTLVVARSV